MTVVAESELRRFRPYPAYKDSGMDWLGEVPGHWGVIPLKFAVKMNPDDLPDSTPDDFRITYVDIGSVTQEKGISWTEEYDFINAPSRARRRVREGDTIISTVRTYLKAVAAIQNPPYNMVVSTGFAVLRPSDGVIANFLSRAVQSDLFISRVVSLSEGVGYPAIAPSTLARINLWLPPDDEQVAIAAFLDRETARIDELVAKKVRLIELLQEKRAALITRAVTKGLDPSVPMKDSGMEWFGDIPANWEVNRLKHISPRLTVGVVVNPSTYVEDEGTVPFIRGVDVSEGAIDTTKIQYMSEFSNKYLCKSTLRTGDLVAIRVGYPGVTAVVPPDLHGSNCASLLIIRSSSGFSSEFICYGMNSLLGKNQFKMLQDGAAQEQINVSDAVDLIFPLPLLEEQCCRFSD